VNKILIGFLSVAIIVGIWLLLSGSDQEIDSSLSQAVPAETVSAPVTAEQVLAPDSNPIVVMETNKGTITIELWSDQAPVSVENFLQYTDNGFYNNLIFHRVIPGFMIQGGGFNSNMMEQSTYPAIKNEATAELKNNRGTLAMARTNVVDSATSQFFINLTDNNFLNHTDTTPSGFGYAVFGQVIEGMDIVDEIAGVATGNARGHQNVPLEPVVIISMTRQ
jgi:cyclophilin family peptidyl-prolyl cis-trans isomerase